MYYGNVKLIKSILSFTLFFNLTLLANSNTYILSKTVQWKFSRIIQPKKHSGETKDSKSKNALILARSSVKERNKNTVPQKTASGEGQKEGNK